MRERIKDILLESIQLKEDLMRNYIDEIIKATRLISESFSKGNKLILFGNGGSAADSQHIAAELVGKFNKDRPGLPAISLTTNSSILTALGNDYGYESTFLKQVIALGRKNDTAVGISTSGKARNVLAAIKEAKKIGLKTIALTGGDGGELAKTADVAIVVPSTSTPRIQEAHITIGHIICDLIEQEFFPD